MNEQQTRELAKQYRERAAIMEASKWVDGKCLNIDSRRLRNNFGVEWFRTNNPCWYFEDYEYRVVEPDEVTYHIWTEKQYLGETHPRLYANHKTLENAKQNAVENGDKVILKVTTKPDSTKYVEFIEVGE
jgi:hypothetical protein